MPIVVSVFGEDRDMDGAALDLVQWWALKDQSLHGLLTTRLWQCCKAEGGLQNVLPPPPLPPPLHDRQFDSVAILFVGFRTRASKPRREKTLFAFFIYLLS